MNAPTRHLMAEVTGTLLYSGWQHTDSLMLDLYGSRPTADDGYLVESVAVHGTRIDIAELLTGTQLEKMGQWLDFKDDVSPPLRWIADCARHEAMRGPYERGGMY